jgi:hypothetical protein
MEIKRTGTQPSAKGPADWFTGTVRINPLFNHFVTVGRKRHDSCAYCCCDWR